MSDEAGQPLLGLDSAHPINLGDETFEDKPTKPKTERLVSLDVFRGITIWFMMLVNNSGGSYYILDHAPWDGVTIADFVMPSFLFIVGAAMTLAFNKLLVSGASKWSLFKKSFIRAFKLYMLGFLLPPMPRWNLAGIRILGVLQRIGVTYLIAAACVIFIPKFKHNASGPFRVLITYLWHWLVALGMLVIYLGLMLGIWVPGCPSRGMLTPACNAAGFIDYHILTPNHMYHHPTCLPDCQYFDPEGTLSTFVATVSIFIGLYFGYHLVHFLDHKSRVLGWVVPSVLMIGAGIGIHFAGMPFNKNLYSISFILLMGGSSGILFALSYLLIDVVKFQVPFYPFVWLGSNSIILYCGDEIIERFLGPGNAMIYYGDPTANLGSWVFKTIYASWMAPEVARMIWGISHACIWILPAFILYRMKIFIRV